MIQVYRTNGVIEDFDKLPCEPDLASIGKWLYGDKADLMEHVRILDPDDPHKAGQMWVHESGKYMGFKENEKATELYLSHHSPRERALAKMAGHVIVGDALVLTANDQLD